MFFAQKFWKNLLSLRSPNLSTSWQSKHLRVEVSNKCQLKCPLCLTGTHYHRKHSAIGWGHLNLKHFKVFLRKNPQIKNTELSNYGELFLHPHIEEILRIAYEKNIRLTL